MASAITLESPKSDHAHTAEPPALAVALGSRAVRQRRAPGGRPAWPRPAVDELSVCRTLASRRPRRRPLAAHGVMPGDRVAIYSENRRGFVLAYLALRHRSDRGPDQRALPRGRPRQHPRRRQAAADRRLRQTRPHVPAETPFINAAEIEAWAADSAPRARSPTRPSARRHRHHHLYERDHRPREGCPITQGNLCRDRRADRRGLALDRATTRCC